MIKDFYRKIKEYKEGCEENCYFRKYMDSQEDGQEVQCTACSKTCVVGSEDKSNDEEYVHVPDLVFVKVNGIPLNECFALFGDGYWLVRREEEDDDEQIRSEKDPD